ncbi:hypothetical protein HK097_009746, partial [Rhizophlyctis rosea]
MDDSTRIEDRPPTDSFQSPDSTDRPPSSDPTTTTSSSQTPTSALPSTPFTSTTPPTSSFHRSSFPDYSPSSISSYPPYPTSLGPLPGSFPYLPPYPPRSSRGAGLPFPSPRGMGGVGGYYGHGAGQWGLPSLSHASVPALGYGMGVGGMSGMEGGIHGGGRVGHHHHHHHHYGGGSEGLPCEVGGVRSLDDGEGGESPVLECGEKYVGPPPSKQAKTTPKQKPTLPKFSTAKPTLPTKPTSTTTKPPNKSPSSPTSSSSSPRPLPSSTAPTQSPQPITFETTITKTLWEDECTLVYQLELKPVDTLDSDKVVNANGGEYGGAGGVGAGGFHGIEGQGGAMGGVQAGTVLVVPTIVTRRVDNGMCNGTKLLNVANLTRGRRDGILKNERPREVVRHGAMHLKGVWIDLDRARALSQHHQIHPLLSPLLADNPDRFIGHVGRVTILAIPALPGGDVGPTPTSSTPSISSHNLHSTTTPTSETGPDEEGRSVGGMVGGDE